MLGIQNPTTGVVEPLNIDEDSWYVTHKYNGGDTLTFEVPIGSEYYKKIAEEVKIEFRSDRSNDAMFVIKNVDEHSDFVSVDAELDLEEWKKSIRDTYRRTNVYLYQVLDEIKPTGWVYVNATSVPGRTTVEDTEGEPLKAVTPLEILDACIEAYGVVFNFDVVNRVLTVVDLSDDTPTGEFFSDELNLRSVGFVGNSSGFATRLYAYGKRDENGENPLTFASINGGKPYVDDNSYSNKVICVGWSDERYTVKEHLLNDARKKLKELAIPERSYTCDVISFEANMWMYKVVTVISRTKGYRVNHRVIEWEEHQRKEDDKVTLSAVPPSVEGLVRNLRDGNSQLRKDMDAGFDNIEGVIKESIEHATDMITGSYGGYFRWIRDTEGHPMELVNLGDSMNIDDAQKVWRWNKNGLGHSNNGYNGPYTLAILADGSINASVITTGTLNAGVIKAGVLQDTRGKNKWELETGEFSLASTTKVGGKTVATIASDAVDAQTQRSIFNKLTNNGQTQGIYLSNGLLYINATYMKAGIISDNAGHNSWNLTTGALTTRNMQATNMTATGSLASGSDTAHKVTVSSGIVRFFYKNASTIELVSIPAYTDGNRGGYLQATNGATYLGLRAPKLYVANNTSEAGTIGGTGTMGYISNIEDIGGGQIQWWHNTINFKNGIMITSF